MSGVLLVSNWQRSDAVNILGCTGQLLLSPTKNYPVQNVNRATVEESFTSGMDVKLWIHRLCGFLTLPRIHLHLTSVTMLCLSKEFLFEKTCCDRVLLVSKGSSLMETCRQTGENLGCREKAYKHCKPFLRAANKNVKRKKVRRPLRISMQVRQVHKVLIKRCPIRTQLEFYYFPQKIKN